MQLLHESPVLLRSAIATALNPSPPVGTTLPPALRALADCGLADQVEQIKITPEYLSTEEMSKLWTAVQSHYRPTAAYLATVVLIESTRPARSAAGAEPGPVDLHGTRRGVIAEPSICAALPTIQSVVPTNKQPAATVGATVDITGHHLDGTNRAVVLSQLAFSDRAGGAGRRRRHRAPPCSSWFPICRWAFINWRFASSDPENRTPAPAISWLWSSVRKSPRLCRSTWPATEQEQRPSRWIVSRKSDPASKCRCC